MNAARTRLIAAAMAAAFAFLPAAEASARGGFRGGGFRSAPSLRSLGGSKAFSGWGSAARPSLKVSPPKAAPLAATPRAGSRLGGISGTRSSVSSQRGLFDSAKRNGTLFSSKAEASQAFKSRYAKDYGSTFASEPALRPSYIPSSAVVDGRNVNITYNSGLGGYGFLHPGLGTWMLFDALGDAAMADSLMASRGYYWGASPVYLSHGSSFLGLAFALLVLFLVAAVAVNVLARRARSARYDEREIR